MKAYFTLALAATFMMSFTMIDVATMTVDVSQSTVNWIGKKVTGTHTGTIALKSGSLEMKKGALTGGSFVIDMNSLQVTDLQGSMADKLGGHLKSDDFFGVANHPTAELKITGVENTGDNTYDVTGDLTIKGITEPITFSTLIAETGAGVSATAKLIIDRTKYDVRYGSGKFFDSLGDKMIYDDFELNVNVLATK